MLKRLMTVFVLSGLIAGGAGCKNKDVVPSGPSFTQYSTEEFDWNSIQRVVVMPVANRSQHPQVAEQMQQAIAAELQRSGRFEAVMAANDAEDPDTNEVFRSGRFDEEKLLGIYHRYHAQGVMFVKITEYHPYSSPRMGLSTLLVNPAEAVVVAATDGQWDLREAGTLARARQWHEADLEFPNSLFESDRVLVSPHTFQRFVAHDIAQALEASTQPSSSSPLEMYSMGSTVMPAGYQSAPAGYSHGQPYPTPASDASGPVLHPESLPQRNEAAPVPASEDDRATWNPRTGRY